MRQPESSAKRPMARRSSAILVTQSFDLSCALAIAAGIHLVYRILGVALIGFLPEGPCLHCPQPRKATSQPQLRYWSRENGPIPWKATKGRSNGGVGPCHATGHGGAHVQPEVTSSLRGWAESIFASRAGHRQHTQVSVMSALPAALRANSGWAEADAIAWYC